jgi:hypothetical protein
MSYRDDVDALAARHAALSEEVKHKAVERDAAERLLAEARARAKLPILDNIRVATPCSQNWAEMTGDDRTRHCAACDKNVYNLSGLTRDEAQALIVEKNGQLCVRYFQRSDGTILLADCEVGKKQKRKRRVFAAAAAATLAGGGFAAYKLTRPAAPKPEVRELAGALEIGPDPVTPPAQHEKYTHIVGAMHVNPPPPPRVDVRKKKSK